MTCAAAPKRMWLTKYIWARSSLNPDIEDFADDFLSTDDHEEQLVGIQEPLSYNSPSPEWKRTKRITECFWIKVTSKSQFWEMTLWNFCNIFSTYLCEVGFSTLSLMKTRFRRRLQPDHRFMMQPCHYAHKVRSISECSTWLSFVLIQGSLLHFGVVLLKCVLSWKCCVFPTSS